jgi:hypothetical protein
MEKFQPQPKPFILKFNEYIKHINEKPINEAKLLKFKEKNQEEFIKNQALLINDRISRQIKEIVAAELAVEETLEVGTVNPYQDDFYKSNLENGYRIQSAPVYDHTMKVCDHRYLKSLVNLDASQLKHTEEINIKYEKEYSHKFRHEQEANEIYFNQKVAAGEMTFIGEMPFDEYIELMKKKPPEVSIQSFELVPCFDGDNGWWSDNNKVYAYIDRGTNLTQTDIYNDPASELKP